MSGPIDASLRKFHASLNVSDLNRSVAFYRVLLGSEPAKTRPDYAKFELAEPPLVLSLIPGHPAAGGQLNHVGLRVRSADELVEIQRRLEAAGLRTEREEGVECCYALQTKFWVTDPDRALWEIYVFHEDIDNRGHASPPSVEPLPMSVAPIATRAWEHRLRDPIPERIPHDDNSLHEVRLAGSINAAPDTEHRSGLLRDVSRVLLPGAAVHVHGLSGDRRSRLTPSLPGPASAVQHVPATEEVIDELVEAGFVQIQIDTLSSPHFVVDGVPMRELRVVGRKPGYRPTAASHRAVYLGPLSKVVDDFGNVFRRGVVTALNVHDWQALSKSTISAAFKLLEPESSTVAGSCCDASEVAASAPVTLHK
jgi:catechol 2,3-dioxygenase-like lactoylglutathione lyase family enzyme